MKDLFKNAGASFWAAAVATVVALVAFIVLIVTNSVVGYAIDNGALLIFLAVVVVLCLVAGLYTNLKFGSNNYITAVLNLVVVIVAAIILANIIISRITLISALFSWDSHNEVGWSAFYSSVVCIVANLISIIAVTVSAFAKK